MTARAVIRERDLERIFRAAKKADVSVRVEVEPAGKVVIIPMRPGAASDAPNPWDED
jgi:hypothetical protein